jgi:hypothetical protein
MTNTTQRTSGLSGVTILIGVALLILALAPLAFLTTDSVWLRWIAIMSLAWWLPGALLVALWRLPDLDLPAAAILATGVGLCWLVLVALLVHWLPGPVALWPLVAAYELGALALLVALLWRRPLALRPATARTWGWLAALLFFACLLRLPGLGYTEFHIDEVEVLRRARWALLGVDNVLTVHTKGPGEIAVAAAVYRALGTATEATARLPFALIGVASVLATALLGRRLFSASAGFWAGLLLGANGFALGPSRMVQYQPAVLLLSVLAVWCAWEFARHGEPGWLALAAVFAAFGLVMHYELALLAPALLLLAWAGWRRAPDKRAVLQVALFSALAGGLLLAAAYLPPLLSPHVAKTQRLLGRRLGGLGALNLTSFLQMGTFYNAIYFFGGLILLVVAGLLVGWRTARRRTLLLVLWFLPFITLQILVMEQPGAHYYIFMPSWSLLAALPLAAVTRSRATRPVLRWAALALVALWFAVSAGYLYLAFFRQAPEYIANYREARLPFYWTAYGDDPPLEPRLGFPLQEGWKVPGTLAQWGCLRGTFASNEGSRHHRGWYLTGLEQVKFEESPNLIFVASHVQWPQRGYDESWLEGYHRVGQVRVRQEPRLDIWAREPAPVPLATLDVEAFAPLFDEAVPALEPGPHPPSLVHEVALGEAVTLESAGLAPTTPAPGDTLHLTLVWRPEQALARDYKVFVHLVGDTGRPVAQWDGYPCFNLAHTRDWASGEAVRDHVLLPVPDGLPPGEWRVVAGLYDETTGQRLGDTTVEIATIRIP